MKTEEIIKYGLVAVGAYLLYIYVIEPMMNPVVTAAAPATGTTTTAATGTTATTTAPSTTTTAPAQPPVAYTPPTMTAQLAAANTTGMSVLDADQWNYYWNQLGFPAVSDTVFASTFFPNGRPSDASQNPTMTAAQFTGALTAAGMTGISGVRGVGDIVMMGQNRGLGGNTGFRRKRVNGFGGNPGRVSQAIN